MPNVYKIAYASKNGLLSALKSRGILTDIEGQNVYAKGTHAVVYLGNIVLEAVEYDAEGNEVKAAVLSSKYHADIMTEKDFDFGGNEIQIKDGEPNAHTFA